MASIKPLIKNFIKHPLTTPSRIIRFFNDMKKYNAMNTRPEFHASLGKIYPFIMEWDGSAGDLGFYFWQDLWGSRKIFSTKPSEHYDIGSRVDGFVAHVLTFMPVTLIDIRPLSQKVENLRFIQADATNLDGIADNSIISLSSLCAVEHFGLGRYGDPVNPESCFDALKSMQRVLAHGGHLYISVPIGDKNGTAFNGCRIFTPETIADTLNELVLEDFAVINKTKYIDHIDFKSFHDMKPGIDYGASVGGLFEFVKE